MEEKKVRELLDKVMHPAINASLLKLGIISDYKVEENGITIEMAYPFPNIPIKDMLKVSIVNALSPLGMEIKFTERVMTEEERQRFLQIEMENWKGL